VFDESPRLLGGAAHRKQTFSFFDAEASDAMLNGEERTPEPRKAAPEARPIEGGSQLEELKGNG